MVQAVLLRRLPEAAGRFFRARKVFRTLFVGIALRLINEFADFDRDQLCAKVVHHFGIQRAAETEALGRVADRGDLQTAHLVPDRSRKDFFGGLLPLFRLLIKKRRDTFVRRSPDRFPYGFPDVFLFGRTENVGKRPVPEVPQRVRRRIGAGQGVQLQPPPVARRLAQGPEKDRAVVAAQDLRHIGTVRESQVLKDDQTGPKRRKKVPKSLHRKQGLVRDNNISVNAFQEPDGACELIGRRFHVESSDADRQIYGN